MVVVYSSHFAIHFPVSIFHTNYLPMSLIYIGSGVLVQSGSRVSIDCVLGVSSGGRYRMDIAHG